MRNTESARNLTFQVAISSNGIKRLYQVQKVPPLSGTIRYLLLYPASYNKLFEIALVRPLNSSKVVQYGEPTGPSQFSIHEPSGLLGRSSEDSIKQGLSALFWWRQADSNRQPPACKAGALPLELHPQTANRYDYSN